MKTYKSKIIALGIAIMVGIILALIGDYAFKDQGVYPKMMSTIGELIAAMAVIRMYIVSFLEKKVKIKDPSMSFEVVSFCDGIIDAIAFAVLIVDFLIITTGNSVICNFYTQYIYSFCSWAITIILFIIVIALQIDRYRRGYK